jgi:arginine deiminase
MRPDAYEITAPAPPAFRPARVRDWVSDHILNEREVGITAAQRGREWASTAALVAEFLIGGITKGHKESTRPSSSCTACRIS